MKGVLYRVASYLAVAFMLLAATEYSGFVSPAPSKYLNIDYLFVVTLTVSFAALGVYLRSGPARERARRRVTLLLVFVLNAMLACVVSVVTMAGVVTVGTSILIYVYASFGSLGFLLAATGEVEEDRRGAEDEQVSQLRADPAFLLALLLFVGALYLFHPEGADEPILGVVLGFVSVATYALASLI